MGNSECGLKVEDCSKLLDILETDLLCMSLNNVVVNWFMKEMTTLIKGIF